jgi:hypothetical protein
MGVPAVRTRLAIAATFTAALIGAPPPALSQGAGTPDWEGVVKDSLGYSYGSLGEDAGKPEEETPPPAVAKPGGPGAAGGTPVLRLVKVLGPAARPVASNTIGIDRKPGERGYVARKKGNPSSRAAYMKIQSAEIVKAPVEIALGEPFTVTTRSKMRFVYRDHGCSGPTNRAWKAKTGTKHGYVALYAGPAAAGRSGAVGVAADQTKDLTSYCAAGKNDGKKGPTEKQGVVDLTITFEPKKTERKDGRTAWHYGAKVDTNGRLSVDSRRPVPLFALGDAVKVDGQGFIGAEGAKAIKPLNRSIEVRVNAYPFYSNGTWDSSPWIALRYSLVTGDDKTLKQLPPFTEPADLARSPKVNPEGETLAKADGSGDGSEAGAGAGSGAAGTGGAGAGTGGGAGVAAVTGAGRSVIAGIKGTGPGGKVLPGDIQGNHPRIAPLIQAWIGQAEPPQNVTEGARFRYSKRGNPVGTTADGGIVTAPHETGAFDPHYLWSRPAKRRLDSVNHCTLEEYVLARVEGRATGRCRGRYRKPPGGYQVALARVIGAKAGVAKARLERAGFKVRVVSAGAPPSKAKEFTVASQKPVTGRVKRGKTVTIGVYSKYVAVLTVPRLIGLSWREADRKARAAGLAPKLRSLGPAKKRADGLRVTGQTPRVGEKVKKGTVVRLTGYGRYVAAAQTQARARQCEQVYSDLFKHVRSGNGNLAQSARTTGKRLRCNPGKMTSAVARGEATRKKDIQRKRQDLAGRCEPVYRDLYDKARAGQVRDVRTAQTTGRFMGCDPSRMTSAISKGQTAFRSDQTRKRQDIARRCKPLYRDLYNKARAGRARDVRTGQTTGARMGCDRNRMAGAISQGQTALRSDQARRRRGTVVTPYGGPSPDMGGCSILGMEC